MFTLAILIGIYSYLIFALGLLGILYKQAVILLTVVYLASIIFYASRFPPRRSPSLLRASFAEAAAKAEQGFAGRVGQLRGVSRDLIKLGKLGILLSVLLILQAVINLIGTLGPELGFDALWYHLTIPKLYLDNHSIFFIPGGLLYYSAMPKLTEMLYVVALALNGEILAKLIHFSFGTLSSIALYKLSRIFFSPKISLVAVVVFYSNLVVAWQSTTAYVDLVRTFFEIMALWGFVNFWKKGEKKWLIESAIMLGLAISTKLLALGSLVIFTILIAFHFFLSSKGPPRRSPSGHLRGVKNLFIGLFVYWVICLLIPLPWFVFSYINTGNPVYPFFTDIYKVGFNIELLNPFRFISEVWTIFMGSSDPISPIYIIFLPLVILFFFRHLRDSGHVHYGSLARMTTFQVIAIYSTLAIIIWYLTPRTGGGRFLLPYLPVFSIVVAGMLEKIGIYPSRERSESRSFKVLDFARTINFKAWCIGLIIFVSLISIVYRGAANAKYIPVIIGIQPKSDFLEKHLNFSFGDFYDTDEYFKKHIKPKDTVLLYGFHNLYYVDFPFIDSSWVKKGDIFNYIATQNTPSADGLPKRFKDWDLVYQNPETFVKLYSKGGIKWVY